MSAGELVAFLKPLGLERYAGMLEEEAITEVDLLRSMGEEMLREVSTHALASASHTAVASIERVVLRAPHYAIML